MQQSAPNMETTDRRLLAAFDLQMQHLTKELKNLVEKESGKR